MASYTIIVDGVTGEITKTLNFMGKDYSEVWKENGTHCDCGLENLVARDFPEMNEADSDIIDELSYLDEDELLDSLGELTEYERTE